MNRPCACGCLILLLSLLGPLSSVAETPASVRSFSDGGGGAFDPQGLVIDSIHIDNREIYNTDNPKYSGFLFRMANRLHVVTKDHIIRRELLLHKGDRFDREIADEMARNLRGRFPFNDAWIEVEKLGANRALMRVVTIDQWSFIGGIKSVDTDGGETDYQVGFEERNFLGRAQFWSFDYFVRETEDNYVALEFYEPRVFGRSYDTRWLYSNNPYHRYKQVSVGRPFYNLAQNFAYGLAWRHGGNRQERFLANREIAQWEDRSDRAELHGSFRWGPSYRKTAITGQYTYLFRTLIERQIFDSTAFLPEEFPTDSVYHQFNIGILHERQRFIVERRINGFDYNEDITLGEAVGLTYGRAFRPGFKGYHYDYIDLLAEIKQKIAGYIIMADYSRSFWYKRGLGTRRLTSLTLRAYNNQLSFLTVAFRSQYLSDKTDNPNGLVLGGKSGLRGYDKEYASGDRVHVVNLEGRFYPGIELLSVKIGAAVFTDFGRAWRRGEAITFRDYYLSLGAGLRLSLERLSRDEMIRIDVIHGQDGQIELSVGTGQYF